MTERSDLFYAMIREDDDEKRAVLREQYVAALQAGADRINRELGPVPTGKRGLVSGRGVAPRDSKELSWFLRFRKRAQ